MQRVTVAYLKEEVSGPKTGSHKMHQIIYWISHIFYFACAACTNHCCNIHISQFTELNRTVWTSATPHNLSAGGYSVGNNTTGTERRPKLDFEQRSKSKSSCLLRSFANVSQLLDGSLVESMLRWRYRWRYWCWNAGRRRNAIVPRAG